MHKNYLPFIQIRCVRCKEGFALSLVLCGASNVEAVKEIIHHFTELCSSINKKFTAGIAHRSILITRKPAPLTSPVAFIWELLVVFSIIQGIFNRDNMVEQLTCKFSGSILNSSTDFDIGLETGDSYVSHSSKIFQI